MIIPLITIHNIVTMMMASRVEPVKVLLLDPLHPSRAVRHPLMEPVNVMIMVMIVLMMVMIIIMMVMMSMMMVMMVVIMIMMMVVVRMMIMMSS